MNPGHFRPCRFCACSILGGERSPAQRQKNLRRIRPEAIGLGKFLRSEEHTSELQSLRHLLYTLFPYTTLFRSLLRVQHPGRRTQPCPAPEEFAAYPA